MPMFLAGAAGRPLWVRTVNYADRLDELLKRNAVTGVINDDPEPGCMTRAALREKAFTG